MMAGSLECQDNMNVICFGKIPNLSSDVFGSFTFGLFGWQNSVSKLLIDDINEFFMGFNSSSWNNDAVRGHIGSLELLNHMGSQVIDIASVSLDGHSQIFPSEGSLEDAISENLIAT